MEVQATQRQHRKDASHRRASSACIRCNNRKVRCDALRTTSTATLTPISRCTNCRLDDQPCIIRPRKRRCPFHISNFATDPIQDLTTASSLLPIMTYVPDELLIQELNAMSYSGETELLTRRTNLQTSRAISSINLVSEKPEHATTLSTRPQGGNPTPGLDRHLIFSYFNFLQVDVLSGMSPEDARTLEVNGCLHIPTRSTLDIIVREYFLHVHPSLPMLDEGQFWNVYRNKDGSQISPRISLFLFQAMLFAGCSYVPLDAIQRCGYKSIQEAQKTLYSRAKMLFDFEAEHDASIIAQGALLLSYYSTNSERHLNTFWLSIAIQSARADHAHYYDNDKSLTRYKRQMKKRLWWCCVLRDRILPLGMRRPLQITHSHLNSAGQELTEEDLEEDIGKSEVYDTETQHLLAKILVAQCKLAIEMTDVITMVYPGDGANLVIAACEEDFNRISLETERVLVKSHASVMLYASLLYIYYHSARLALFHHKILALEMWTSSLGESQDTYVRQLDLFRGELQSSTATVTYIVQDLLRLNLGQYLPISAVAYTALPLVLSVLDVKVPANSSQPRMRYLETYHKSMELYLNRYNGIDEVSSMMERILEEAESNSRKVCLPPAFFSQREANHPSLSTSDWYEIFVQQPKFHLRVVQSFDLSFSNGKFPEDSDFPKQLRADQLEEVPYSHSLMLGENNLDTDVLTSLLLQVSASTLDGTDLKTPNMTPARRDLDFMDLFKVTTPGRVRDISMDLDAGDGDDFMDFFLEERNDEEGADDDRGWEKVIWDLFDHAIPG